MCENSDLLCVSLSLQREGMGKTDSRSRPSPEGTPVAFVDRYLEKHITPFTLKSNLKRNPLYMAMRETDVADTKSKPSWTVKEYDTQIVHGNLADYLKVICERELEESKLWVSDRMNECLRDGLCRDRQLDDCRETVGWFQGLA